MIISTKMFIVGVGDGKWRSIRSERSLSELHNCVDDEREKIIGYNKPRSSNLLPYLGYRMHTRNSQLAGEYVGHRTLVDEGSNRKRIHVIVLYSTSAAVTVCWFAPGIT